MHMNADMPTGSIGNIQLADTFLRVICLMIVDQGAGKPPP